MKLAYDLGATFDYQQNIIGCMDQYRAVKKPRQAGMTTAFAIEALIDAITLDDYVVCIVSPTARQSDRMMRYVKQAFRKLETIKGSKIPTEKFTSEEIYFHHGSEIHSLPNNPLGIQGIACNHAIVDEAGLFAQNEGNEIIDAIVGSLGAKSGRLTISGRPHGKRGFLWDYWDETNDRYKEFTHFAITWENRAKYDKKYGDEVAKHKAILPKHQFDEIYNAEFIDEGVLIYPHELLQNAIDLWNKRGFTRSSWEANIPSGNYFIGIDFGRKRSLTEIHVLRREDDGILRTVTMKSLDNINFEDQKRYIDDIIKRIRPIMVEVDERGMGLPILDYLISIHGESRIKPLQFSGLTTKERTVLQLRNVLTDNQLAIPNDDELYTQLHCYQKEFTDMGNVRYFGKVDETDFKDDKVVALIAAVDAARNPAFTFKIV